ncbi:MAG: NAD(P)H-dependent oxidoreductase [Ignavibacteria bacterium]|nr:NAD(P)H-dependent oxidoreductase [Ignavibacteria bacterium]
MGKKFNIIAFAGSLRKSSYNKYLINNIKKLGIEKLNIEIIDLKDIPLYNEDVEKEGLPEAVEKLRNKISEADGVIIATPEYNYSFSGVLKNTIDWISRPPNQPLNGKPLAIVGASMGPSGTIRAQLHLRHSLIYLNPIILNKPEIFVPFAHEKFDVDGNLKDEDTTKFIKMFIDSFYQWIRKINCISD